jgi:hypothetical protein
MHGAQAGDFSVAIRKRGGVMKRLLLVGFFLLAVTASKPSMAADAFGAWTNGLPTAWVTGPACDPWVDYACDPPKVSPKQLKNMPCDPYLNYSCLDDYLGQDFWTRLYRYYVLEWGKAVAPADPHAPASQRPDNSRYALAAANLPEPTPPMPFVAWPYGGTQNIGATLPNAIDSPLMVALGNTAFGKWLNDLHIQIYGWVDPAGNISSNTVRAAGNLPVSYDYTPNTVQLDQAVLYIERVPDEVQNDHFDWGFRVSGIYGVDERYTFGYGYLQPYQVTRWNAVNGYDDPMMYVDLYWPVLLGLNVRIGRFISIPDIEAQLAPNNYTYVHSMTYSWDNYTNDGIEFTLAVTKNWILQLGSTVGTESPFWHLFQHIPNQYVLQGMNTAGFGPGVDPLFPGASMPKDPGAIPSVSMGIKWEADDGRDSLNFVMDAWNSGTWGYNNLQWMGFTYYHKFNDYWHFDFETWNVHIRNVPDLNNAGAQALLFGLTPNTGYGTPFSTAIMPGEGGPVNAAWCLGPSQFGVITASAPLTCTSDTQTMLLYVNYSPNKLNNFSFRAEYFNDPNGQRTGIPTAYAETGIGWQHWFSPQVEVRPEIAYYRSLNNPAFNGNPAEGIPATRDWQLVASGDIIWHF